MKMRYIFLSTMLVFLVNFTSVRRNILRTAVELMHLLEVLLFKVRRLNETTLSSASSTE